MSLVSNQARKSAAPKATADKPPVTPDAYLSAGMEAVVLNQLYEPTAWKREPFVPVYDPANGERFTLPDGARLRFLGDRRTTADRPEDCEVEVLDGPHAGRRVLAFYVDVIGPDDYQNELAQRRGLADPRTGKRAR